MDSKNYTEYLCDKEAEFEAICTRCGACCGAEDDPCQNLVRSGEGKYHCKDYENRFVEQKTVSGKTFRCVPIREHMAKGSLRPSCMYRIIC